MKDSAGFPGKFSRENHGKTIRRATIAPIHSGNPMRRALVFLLTVSFILAPALSFAQQKTTHVFTASEKERLFRSCKKADPRQRERCETRQIARAQEEWGKSHPTDAFALYDRLDLGKNHLRSNLQTNRRILFERHWSLNRKTFSEFEPVDNFNTRRLPYMNTVREEELNCMYEPHGRPRTLCLEWQKDRAQKMKAPVPNQ